MRGAELALGAFETGRYGDALRLHAWRPGTKILLVLFGSVLLSAAARLLPPGISLACSFAALTLVGALGFWGGYSLPRLLRFCAPAALVLGLFLTVDLLLWMLVPSVRPAHQGTAEHLGRVLAQTAAVLAMILASRLLVATTRVSSLIDTLTSSTAFLKPLGFRPDIFALTVSLVIRSIPILGGAITQMSTAHRARGLRPTPRSVLTPVAMGAAAAAIAASEALAARMLPAEAPSRAEAHSLPRPAGQSMDNTHGQDPHRQAGAS